MINEQEVLGRYAGLRRRTLHIWIERGWVAPKRDAMGYRFREIDAARIGMIHEFSSELALGEDAMEIVLGLLDQVHGLRHQLRCLAEAVSAEPDDVRRRIAETLDTHQRR